MDRKYYREHTGKFFIGKKVRTLVPMQNGWGEITEGIIATIVLKYMGFNLKTDACKYCNTRVFISRVAPSKVALLLE